jgi:hypothetical protein
MRERVAAEQVLVVDDQQRQLVWSIDATSSVSRHVVGFEREFHFELFHEGDQEHLLESWAPS